MAISIVSCGIGARWPHENFVQQLEYQVGKSANDPHTDLARYPKRILGSKILANGNTEIEYDYSIAPDRRGECHVFFEVDPGTNIIVDWRYDGTEKSCVLPP